MKKRYLVIGLLASSFSAFSQRSDSTYTKKNLSHTDVQMLFSYYTQDNNHSAVTGGIGTENLQVYAPQLSLNYIKDSVRTIHYEAGFDVITSASTDNIDFVVSSSSKTDTRWHSSAGYSHYLKDKRTTVGGSFSFSMESDYLSLGPSVSLNHINKSQTREISVAVQTYFDDLRWGRYQGENPLKLVYPFELRGTEWFTIHKRNSYNLVMGLSQTINQRMSLGFYPGLSYQSGLLSTPFHRVYFTDNSKRVENMPTERIRVPIGIQLNTFIGHRWILRTYYRYYWDDFGIEAHTLNLESAVKFSQVFTVTPFVRLYNQTKADFFKPYAQHDVSQQYYTSDYDLSHFHDIKAGMGVRYAPYARGKRATFKEVELRFAHYKRSDGLHANMLTLYINYDKEAKD